MTYNTLKDNMGFYFSTLYELCCCKSVFSNLGKLANNGKISFSKGRTGSSSIIKDNKENFTILANELTSTDAS